MAEIAHAAEASPVIHGRCRVEDHETAAASVLHAAVELAEDLDCAALVIPSATGGGARACAKYRPGRPIVALVHDEQVGNQLALESGVLVGRMDVADSVDDLVEDALVCAGRVAGLPSGASVVLTAGRRTGTPGATSLIMVREIP
jgi:pyruvate kinase